jgi:diacylglycerol O-acyltransferase / wax synthase
MLEQRLDLAPRLRQVSYRPRFGLGPPLWVDDAGFDIRKHVRTRAVPAPGHEETLLTVCAQLNEPPLDRSRPLWERWVLTGLPDGNVAFLIRLHHVVADGIAALALIGALFDVAPDAPAPAPQRWLSRPMPDS